MMEAESIDDEETTDRGGSINNGRSTDDGMIKGPIDGSLVLCKQLMKDITITTHDRAMMNTKWSVSNEEVC